jgi:uncharacterized protein YbbC (DUF1343 family)
MRRRDFLRSTGLATAALAARPAAAEPLPAAAITLGDEVFLRSAWHELQGRTVGIITNQTGVTSRLQSIVDALRANSEIRLKAIYAPEHGFRGDRPAGSYVPSYTDAASGLPVYSLYGPTRHPSAAMLEGVDVLLYDIQDVGSRAYTFISTMAYAMQTAREMNREIWILDRPNPVGGTLVEGPVLEPAFASFIGLYPIAMRHGMTVGELAKLFNDHFGVGAKLRVVPMRGYSREMIWPQTGLQWVQSSPNIPDWQTTFPYLCTGLIDNLGINNGVGTAEPFFYAGMVNVDAIALSARLNARDLPGVYFRAASWSPFAGFWLNKELHGVELVIFDPARFEAVRTAVELAVAVRETAPNVIDIKDPAALDRDWGTDSLRKGLVEGKSAEQIAEGWQSNLAAFRALRSKYLLY